MRKQVTALLCFCLMALHGISQTQAMEPVDRIMGAYRGFYNQKKKQTVPAEARVIAEGNGRYRAVLIAYTDPPLKEEITYESMDEKGVLTEKGGPDDWSGMITRGMLTAMAGDRNFLMLPDPTRSPTEGQKPPPGAVVLLPFAEGKETTLDEWTNKSWTLQPDGSMQVGKGANRTEREHGSGLFHLEFMIPFEPEARGQGRGNSGVYFTSRYEVQILDSFGLESGMGDCGSIYGVAITKENACLPPLQWQTYDVIYNAPVKNSEGVLEPAIMTVFHNGVKIHENQPVPKPTTAAPEKENAEKGPLYLQDHGNRVSYRNIWYVPLAE